MAGMRVLLVGEGRHELGGYRDCYARRDELPPLAMLVRRLAGGSGTIRFFCCRGKDIRNVHRGRMASAWGKKAYSAIWCAQNGMDGKTFSAVVCVVDRDGSRNAERLAEMKEGRNRYDDPRFPCALGVAVEAFDAWMIADAGAIRAAAGDASKAQTAPEKASRPKDLADAIFGTTGGTGLGPRYALVATNVDLPLLARACPQGFAPFAEEVRGRIGAVVSRNAN